MRPVPQLFLRSHTLSALGSASCHGLVVNSLSDPERGRLCCLFNMCHKFASITDLVEWKRGSCSYVVREFSTPDDTKTVVWLLVAEITWKVVQLL